MKKLALALILTVTSNCFAQQNSMSTTLPKPVDNSQNGLYVGLDYMNLTDIHIKWESHSSDFSGTAKDEGGFHLGLAGVSFGYNKTPEQGLGVSAGLRLFQKLNHNENGDNTKIQIIVPEANFTLAANRYLTGYAGLNAAVLTGSTSTNDYRTQLGGQVGLGLRFTRNVAMNAGYTIIRQKVSYRSADYSSDADFQFSGFNSNVTYTF